MFAKRLGMRTIARSPLGFVTCDIHTRARVKESVRERHSRQSERDKRCLERLLHTGEKQDTNIHPSYLNHVPAFHVFDSAHHVAFLFVNLHVQVVDVRADVFPSRAHLFISTQRERKQAHIEVVSTRVFLSKFARLSTQHFTEQTYTHSRATFDRFRYTHVTHKR